MLQNAMDDLSDDEQEMLKAALSAMSGRLDQLMDWLTSGDGPTREELEQLAERAGVQWAHNQQEGAWVTRRMLQQMGMTHLEDQLRELMERLAEMGMSREAIEKLMGIVEANREALAEQVAESVGRQIAEQRANRPDDLFGSDLMHKPFEALSQEEANLLRKEVQRLVTQLRSRAALRRKRGKEGRFDSKGTIRANQRYGGVPMELKFKRKKLKPSLVLICDISRSMLSVAEFMLRLTYELQDQVAKTRSFGFYSDMEEISLVLSGNRAAEAVILSLEETSSLDSTTLDGLIECDAELTALGRRLFLARVKQAVVDTLATAGAHDLAQRAAQNFSVSDAWKAARTAIGAPRA